MRLQLRQRLAIARALGQHVLPQSLRLGMIASLDGQGGQVAPGHVAVDPLIEAAKLVGTLQLQDQPPASFGLGSLAPMPVHHRLAKPQFSILAIELQALGARAQGFLDRKSVV